MTSNEQNPANFQIRPATMADQVGIAAVLNTSSLASTGTQVTTPGRIGRWFRVYEKEIRPGQDWVIRNPTLK